MRYQRFMMGALLSVGVLSGCVELCTGAPCLVGDGNPVPIVIADNPPRMVKLAAVELQRYLEKISGARLVVTNTPGTNVTAHIYVGRSSYTDQLGITDEGLQYGAFRMVSVKDGLVLLGHDADFVLPQYVARSSDDIVRALKEWDERTGEHWQNPYAGARLHREYNPKLGVSRRDDRGSFNAVCEFLRGLGVRWYMPGDLGEIVPTIKTIPLAQVDRTVRPDFPYRNLGDYSPTFDGATPEAAMYILHSGIEPNIGIPGPHGLCDVIGREETKKAHPEFYCGHHTPRLDDHYYGACFSSPELVDYTVKYARKVFEIYPDLKYISIWPNDGFVFCSCPLCKGKATPERGGAGSASDYVWAFVERVAEELNKTHPDRKVICGAYGVYTLPPLKIATFSPNVMVGIVDARARFSDPELHARALETRQGYLDRLAPGNLHTYNHYLSSSSRLPCYFPHAIAEDLRALKGISDGEYIELAQGNPASAMHAPGFNHLNVYVTARYYWDADQDIDALLGEYYEKFYGPAAKGMQAFIEFSESNWLKMDKEEGLAGRAVELLDAARKAAGDSVYGQRIQLVVDYGRDPLTQLRDRLAKGRSKELPQIQGAFQGRRADITIDGKFDDAFWKGAIWCSHGSLSELETGSNPYMGTSFTVGWADDAVCFKISCAERSPSEMRITAVKPDDDAIYKGDFVEILLETQVHSYYRIAVAPNGVVVDSDETPNGSVPAWSSKAEVATQIGDGFWTVELRIPMDWDPAKAVDPLNGVAGYKPTALYPLNFNLCRQRARDRGTERSAFSPTGKPVFHETAKFGELVVR